MAIRVTRAGMGLAVGIIILAGVLFGGLWLVKERGEQARRDEAVKVAEQNLEKQSNNQVAAQNDTKDEQNKDEQSTGTSDQSTTQGATEQTDTTSTEEATGSSVANETSTTGSASVATELPQTGPVESSLLTAIAIAAVTFAGVSYWRSRRLLFEVK